MSVSYKYFHAAEIMPKVVLAGDSVEFVIRLFPNRCFRAEDSRMILDMPACLGTSRPTLYHQELSGFMEVFCSNPDVVYTKRVWDIQAQEFTNASGVSKSHLSMGQRMFVLDFLKGEVKEGDEFTIKWGYVCDGYSTGTKVTTIVPLKEFFNTVHVRYFLDGSKGLPDFCRSFKGYDRPKPDEEIALSFRVLPREPDKMRLVKRRNKINLLVMDRFYNAVPVDCVKEYIHEDIEMEKNSAGVFESTDRNLSVTSRRLPLKTTPDVRNAYKDYHLFFGDLHTHSSVSVDCLEREKLEMTPDRCYAFARDVACLDFLAVTDHHQPWGEERKKIGEDNWRMINDAVRRYNKKDEFIAFPGFEFTCERGDTTVVFGEYLDYEKIDQGHLRNIKDLWKEFEGREYITIPHFHNPGKLREGDWYACPYQGVEPCLEIFSCHGSYERMDVLERHVAEIKTMRPDRQGVYFLDKGYHYGFICNSDGHKGNPGFNGLTAVYARELSHASILDAIRMRRVYGTTNARIRLIFTINGEFMGSVLPDTDRKQIYVSAVGEEKIKAVDIFKDGVLLKRFKPYEAGFETEFTLWEDESRYLYVRVTQIDNHIAYSSPIWFKER